MAGVYIEISVGVNQDVHDYHFLCCTFSGQMYIYICAY